MTASKRQQLPDSVRAQERQWITQFVLTHVVEDDQTKATPMHVVYDEYCDWLARRDLGPTKLSLDGFGRLFPKNFERKVVGFDGKTYKAVMGVKVER